MTSGLGELGHEWDAYLGDHDDYEVLIADLVFFKRSVILEHLEADTAFEAMPRECCIGDCGGKVSLRLPCPGR